MLFSFFDILIDIQYVYWDFYTLLLISTLQILVSPNYMQTPSATNSERKYEGMDDIQIVIGLYINIITTLLNIWITAIITGALIFPVFTFIFCYFVNKVKNIIVKHETSLSISVTNSFDNPVLKSWGTLFMILLPDGVEAQGWLNKRFIFFMYLKNTQMSLLAILIICLKYVPLYTDDYKFSRTLKMIETNC